MPKQQLTLEQRLSSKKISIERFQRESLSLIAAGFTNNQAEKLIIRQNSKPDIEFILVNMPVLITEPFNLSHEQIVKIGTNYKSRQIFITFQDKFQNLIKIGLTKEQLIRIASHDGGSRNIEAISNSFAALSALGLNAEQIVKIASHDGGWPYIKTAALRGHLFEC